MRELITSVAGCAACLLSGCLVSLDGLTGGDSGEAGHDGAAPDDALVPDAAGADIGDGQPAPEDGSFDVGITPDAGIDSSVADAPAECGSTFGDPLNCGACGHSCLGGTCLGSVCQPVVFATGQDYPVGIAVDDANVYWTAAGAPSTVDAGTAMECAVGGCLNTPTPLGSFQNNPWAIAVVHGDVYWADTCAIMKCASGCNGNPTTFATGQCASALAVDQANVYWTDFYGGTVLKCPTNGCGTPTILASGLNEPTGIAIDATNVYWTNYLGGTVMKCAIAGCAGNPTTIASAQDSPWGIAVDQTSVYWTNNNDPGEVMKCTLSGCGDAGATTLASTQSYPVAIAVDETNAFWTDYNSATVMKCAIGGCGNNPTPLASGQSFPEGIVVDNTSVYWVNNVAASGTVMRVAK